MKKLIVLSLLIISIGSFAQDLPEHSTRLYVTDLANVMSDAQELALDKRIRDYKAVTTTDFAVATVPTLQGTDVADFGNKLFKKWKIGTAKYNNGLLILVCPAEHKWRIEVGYGLEPFLTDAYTKEKAMSLLKPNFKQNKYFEGIDALIADFTAKLGSTDFGTMQASYKKTQDELAAEAAAQAERDRIESERSTAAFISGLLWFLGIIAVIGFIVFIIYLDRKKKREIQEAKEKAEREEAARQRRVADLKSRILAIKKYRETTEVKVRIIESFKYDIGQQDMRKIFEQDCDEISREIVELSDFETELETTLARLNRIVKESEHAIKEHEIQMKAVTETERNMNNIPQSISVLKSQQLESAVVYQSIKRKYAPEVCKLMVDPDVTSYMSEATAAYEAAKSLMSQSKITEAAKKIEHANSYLTKANSIIRQPYEVRDQINKAESIISKAESEFNSRKTKGDRLHSDGDVESSSKRKLTDAKTKLAGFTKTGNPLVDAAAVLAILSAFDSANNAMQSDIDEAERKRKKKRDDEARKKREEEEEDDRRRRSSSSSYGSSYGSSSSCSSSSSSCSSSSFGGGDSGGGGSSGDW